MALEVCKVVTVAPASSVATVCVIVAIHSAASRGGRGSACCCTGGGRRTLRAQAFSKNQHSHTHTHDSHTLPAAAADNLKPKVSNTRARTHASRSLFHRGARKRTSPLKFQHTPGSSRCMYCAGRYRAVLTSPLRLKQTPEFSLQNPLQFAYLQSASAEQNPATLGVTIRERRSNDARMLGHILTHASSARGR